MAVDSIEQLVRRSEAGGDAVNTRHPEVDAYITEVLNTAAHLLRTPMTPMLLDVAALKKHIAPEGAKILASMSRNILRLQQTVEDFIDLATIRRDGLPVSSCELNSTVQAAVSGSLAPHRCTWRPARMLAVGDTEWVTRALSGLLDLILQASEGSLEISIGRTPRPSIHITSSMPASRAVETMDTFDPRAANHAAATLGMSVAQAVAHSFDGYLEVKGDEALSTISWHFSEAKPPSEPRIAG